MFSACGLARSRTRYARAILLRSRYTATLALYCYARATTLALYYARAILRSRYTTLAQRTCEEANDGASASPSARSHGTTSTSARGGSSTRPARRCFELFGFDVMLDADARPWLLEVNVSPDLASSSPLDERLKGSLVSDTLHLVGIRAPAPVEAAAGGAAAAAVPAARELLRPIAPQLAMLVETEEEWARAEQTGFRRLHPATTAPMRRKLGQLMPQASPADELLERHCKRPAEVRLAELQQVLHAVGKAADGAAATRRKLVPLPSERRSPPPSERRSPPPSERRSPPPSERRSPPPSERRYFARTGGAAPIPAHEHAELAC